MNKKNLFIGLIIILVIVLSFVVFMNFSSEKTGCDWRPPKDYIGACPMIAGYYFDGTGCHSLGACVDEKSDILEIIPFQTAEECIAACEK